jgi:two-component system response regulator BaeR
VSTDAPRERVLIVEDDIKIARLLADYLQAAGYRTDIERDGTLGLQHALQTPPDLLVLDLNLPGMDGLEVCRNLRLRSAVPILMLTARVDEVDRLLGLEGGADDYVCKPFSPREVVARVAAQLRRAAGRFTTAAVWEIDAAGQRIRWAGEWLVLTPAEYRVFALLLSHPGRVYGRAQLLDAAHDDFRDVSDRAIDSHIKNIRRKLATALPESDCIASVYGVGYRFEPH